MNTHYCFPTNKADFDAAFIDKSEGKLLNEELSARRITGLVSYYMPPRNENDFPYQHETQVVYTPMSMSQYLYYENIRFEELEKEAQKKTKMLVAPQCFAMFCQKFCRKHWSILKLPS